MPIIQALRLAAESYSRADADELRSRLASRQESATRIVSSSVRSRLATKRRAIRPSAQTCLWPGRVCETVLESRHLSKQERGTDLSLRPMRRSLIAALALGGAWPSPPRRRPARSPWAGVTQRGQRPSTTADNGLIQAQNLFVLTNGILVADSQPPIDAGFTTAYTSASSLTTATVAEIGPTSARPPTSARLSSGCASLVASPPNRCRRPNIRRSHLASRRRPRDRRGHGVHGHRSARRGISSRQLGDWTLVTQLVRDSDSAHVAGSLNSVDGDLGHRSTGTVTSADGSRHCRTVSGGALSRAAMWFRAASR